MSQTLPNMMENTIAKHKISAVINRIFFCIVISSFLIS